MRLKPLLICLVLPLLLTNCAHYDFSRRIVQQGNLLPQEKIERLKIGLSKEDTAILMGTSLLSPTFNNDRWDYAYTQRKGNGPVMVKNLSLYFSQGQLASIERS
jgi:outer membrane protein assembly factor BamE